MVMGMTPAEVDKLAKLVPEQLNITLDGALKSEPLLREAERNDPRAAKVLEYARLLENLPRHAGTHAAGVVIGDKPLMEHLPLCRASVDEKSGETDKVATQFEMKGVESIGLIKFDFLGLKTLTAIDHCLKILARRGVEVDFRTQDFRDGPT